MDLAQLVATPPAIAVDYEIKFTEPAIKFAEKWGGIEAVELKIRTEIDECLDVNNTKLADVLLHTVTMAKDFKRENCFFCRAENETTLLVDIEGSLE